MTEEANWKTKKEKLLNESERKTNNYTAEFPD